MPLASPFSCAAKEANDKNITKHDQLPTFLFKIPEYLWTLSVSDCKFVVNLHPANVECMASC
jgi:hypothetical protein